MVTTEERLKVLKMIEDGTINVVDGAQLLTTLSSQPTSRRPLRAVPGSPKDPRMLRVRVDGPTGKLKVNVVLPMALVNAGLNIASNFIEGINEQHYSELIDAIQDGQTGLILDYLDDEDGEHVQVFIE